MLTLRLDKRLAPIVLTHTYPLILISGAPGTGKTTLALEMMYRVIQRSQHRIDAVLPDIDEVPEHQECVLRLYAAIKDLARLGTRLRVFSRLGELPIATDVHQRATHLQVVDSAAELLEEKLLHTGSPLILIVQNLSDIRPQIRHQILPNCHTWFSRPDDIRSELQAIEHDVPLSHRESFEQQYRKLCQSLKRHSQRFTDFAVVRRNRHCMTRLRLPHPATVFRMNIKSQVDVPM